MIGRKILPQRYLDWNQRWKAPLPSRRPFKFFVLRLPFVARRVLSPFNFQPNSTTRTFEYPWAFEALDPQPGHVIVEVGGALSGFQFVLARSGAHVVNVDPFFDYGAYSSYAQDPDPQVALRRMNKVWKTQVELRRTTLENADIATESVDAVVCVSTIEHLPADQRAVIIDQAARILKVGGRLVLTVDLFLDVTPFTDEKTNRWGTNVDIADLVSHPQLQLIEGDRRELLGFAEFDIDHVRASLPDLFQGVYPGLAQALVLERIAGTG